MSRVRLESNGDIVNGLTGHESDETDSDMGTENAQVEKSVSNPDFSLKGETINLADLEIRKTDLVIGLLLLNIVLGRV